MKLEFTNAPVAEVVIGVQFKGAPIPIDLLFQVYNQFTEKYPVIQEHPPLNPFVEKASGIPDSSFLPGFFSRKFFINKTNDKLIQIQQDRLLFNWRRKEDQEQYPHFKVVLADFMEVYNFINSKVQLDGQLKQYEVTYWDQINIEEFGRSDYNPKGALKILSIDSEINGIDVQYSIPNSEMGGNLRVGLRQGVRNSDMKKIILLETTMRGFSDKIPIAEWCDKAHNQLLTYFDSIITDNAFKKWGGSK